MKIIKGVPDILAQFFNSTATLIRHHNKAVNDFEAITDIQVKPQAKVSKYK